MLGRERGSLLAHAAAGGGTPTVLFVNGTAATEIYTLSLRDAGRGANKATLKQNFGETLQVNHMSPGGGGA